MKNLMAFKIHSNNYELLSKTILIDHKKRDKEVKVCIVIR